jgi:hypothetical protein
VRAYSFELLVLFADERVVWVHKSIIPGSVGSRFR